MSDQGRSLPLHVQKEFDEYLKCGRLEHGFLRVQCCSCHHDVETCVQYGGSINVIACIDGQPVIDKILSHLEKKGELLSMPDTLPETRAPPPVNLFY